MIAQTIVLGIDIGSRGALAIMSAEGDLRHV